MLFPRTHAWTPLQKWAIVVSGVAGISLLSVLVYHFERYHGLPDDSIFVGTWRFPPLDDKDIYFRLNPDHTFRAFTDELPETETPLKGRWFGGGDFLYFRRPIVDEAGFVTEHPLYFWRIESIAPNELHVRLNPNGVPRTVLRVTSHSP